MYVDCRIDTEILDLLPDDQETIQKQRSEYHWDKVLKNTHLIYKQSSDSQEVFIYPFSVIRNVRSL